MPHKFPVQAVIEKLEAVHGKAKRMARFEPMEELVSCILSQHTTDASSFPAFTRLREAFPDWADMAVASPEDVIPLIRLAGLPNQKSKSILGCLREIHKRTGSYSLEVLRDVPTEQAEAWLTSLPGVGPKTAAIVLCFSFGRDTIPVDTHVYRVAWRLGIIPEGVGEPKAHVLLRKAVPAGLAFRFHVALIQHGRKICKAPLPNCEACPVIESCRWYKQDGPNKRRKTLAKTRKQKEIVGTKRAG